MKLTVAKVVFKYYFLWQYAQSSWKETNLWMRLPRHPNIVSFDRIVVDELEGRIVGFTNNYVPGRTVLVHCFRVELKGYLYFDPILILIYTKKGTTIQEQ